MGMKADREPGFLKRFRDIPGAEKAEFFSFGGFVLPQNILRGERCEQITVLWTAPLAGLLLKENRAAFSLFPKST